MQFLASDEEPRFVEVFFNSYCLELLYHISNFFRIASRKSFVLNLENWKNRKDESNRNYISVLSVAVDSTLQICSIWKMNWKTGKSRLSMISLIEHIVILIIPLIF